MLLTAAMGASGGETRTTPEQLRRATTDEEGFERMAEPEPGDWLDAFEEPGQTFEEYRGSQPVRARPGEALALLPVGPFAPHEREVLDATVELARLWFDLGARVLEARPLPEKGWHRTRGGRVQYETGYFLRFLLPNEMPRDAVTLFGVTMADLYPDENWNFVFGQASLKGRVGVWSFARFFAGFAGAEETAETRLRALRRGLKLVVHEAGHAFGLAHCIEYACVMNGSNSLDEADRRPLRLCPPCLRKLQWNRGFDVLRRYGALAAFYDAKGLGPEARWVRARLRRLRS